jgi:hypothetical protein
MSSKEKAIWEARKKQVADKPDKKGEKKSELECDTINCAT